MQHNNATCMLCAFHLRLSESKVGCIAKPDGTKLAPEEIPEKAVDIIERGIKGECPIRKITQPDSKWVDESLTPEEKAKRDQQAKEAEANRLEKFHATWDRFQRLARYDKLTLAIINDGLQYIGCSSCSKHFQDGMRRNPLPMTNQFSWIVARHDEVNAVTGKPVFGLAAAEAKYPLT
jgi:hypothetical protein